MNDRPQRRRNGKRAKRSANRLSVRKVTDEEVFELVHPPCARARKEDLAEVRAMLEAGEIDVAVDELRWLLEGCHELVEAHELLGRIALSEGDLPLARAHLGRAYELVLQTIPKGGLRGTLPYAREANRAFFAAGRGLVECLIRSGESGLAAEVTGQLLALDPSDPLAVSELLAGSGGA